MNEGIRLYRQKKFRQALDVFLSVHVEDSEQPTLSYYIGLCYAHLEKHDEALLYLEQVVNSDIGFLHIYQSRMIMGYIYAVSGRYRLAEFELNRLLEDGYESAKVYAALAYAIYAQRKTAPAIANLEKALKIDPDNANARNSLGFILAENEIQLDLALEHCQKAVNRYPKNAAYLDSLALVQRRRGNLQQAKVLYEQAVRISGGNPEIVGHYKELLQAAGVNV
ncbi:MAG: tetratricopeptide repeat protein [Spirochaeta sp.]|jgi:tetratricopeptide (TPR) repeat protein|nr:tetratricopeptide repeat protein [Spirochaeta sp.]